MIQNSIFIFYYQRWQFYLFFISLCNIICWSQDPIGKLSDENIKAYIFQLKYIQPSKNKLHYNLIIYFRNFIILFNIFLMLRLNIFLQKSFSITLLILQIIIQVCTSLEDQKVFKTNFTSTPHPEIQFQISYAIGTYTDCLYKIFE